VSEHRDPDDALLEELAALLGRVDPVPAEVTEFAEAALGWRRLDADLAELLADSALETEAAAGVRGAGAGRWLTFETADLSIAVEVRPEAGGHTVLGQLAPPLAGSRIEAQSADGTVMATAESDDLGRFRLTLAGTGRIRFRVVRPDPAAPPVETSWLTL
jgi:hypothetical protein